MYPHLVHIYRLNNFWDRRHFRHPVSSADAFRGSRIGVVISLALLAFTLGSLTVLYRISSDLATPAQPRPSVVNQPTDMASPVPDAAADDRMLQDPRYWRTVDVAYHSNRRLLSTGSNVSNVFRPLPAGPYYGRVLLPHQADNAWDFIAQGEHSLTTVYLGSGFVQSVGPEGGSIMPEQDAPIRSKRSL